MGDRIGLRDAVRIIGKTVEQKTGLSIGSESALALYLLVFIAFNFAGVSLLSPSVWAPYVTSNSNAPAGSLWVEGNTIHWTDGNQEYFFGSSETTVVDSSSPGPLGSLWIEGSNIHWIDSDGDEISFTGADTGNNPSAPLGSAWIESQTVTGTALYPPYFDFASPMDYYISANPPGQTWDDGPSLTGTSTPDAPYSDEWTYTDGGSDNNEQHYFNSDGDTFGWNTGEYLVVWVHPVVNQKANKFMVQIHTGADGWSNRVQWGGSSCKYGTDGSTCNIVSTNTPPAGRWSAMVIQCGDTGSGSCGETVDGLAFTTDDGAHDTYWDSGIVATDITLTQFHYIDANGNERVLKVPR